jgi:hypothetical protein
MAQFLAQVDLLITADNDEFSSSNRETQIKAAVERYSRDKPDRLTKDITGDGGKFYNVTGLTGWIEDFSEVLTIEYPPATVASDETPQTLSNEDWRDDYWDSTNRYIFFPNHAPASTETFRVTYLAPYPFASSAFATPAQDFYAICNLAAGLICQALAAKYSRTTDSTIALDAVDHPSRGREFAARAKEFIALYEDQLGLKRTGAGREAARQEPPSGAFVDWDTAPGWPAQRDYLFHGRNVR